MTEAQSPAHAGRVVVAKTLLLRNGIQGFPAIQNDGSDAAARINASLARYDQKVLSAAKDCDSSLSGSETSGGSGEETWARTVEVTMRGPHYISYVAKDNYFCGGNHPDAWTFALVYDLQTGELVDWTKLFAKHSANAQMQTNDDGSQSQTVISASLAKVYAGKVLPALDKDCADAIGSEDFASGFSIWPDAKAGGLVVHPNLSYVIAACGEDVSLSAEEQRGMGVSDEMIVAIQAAHAAVAHLAD